MMQKVLCSNNTVWLCGFVRSQWPEVADFLLFLRQVVRGLTLSTRTFLRVSVDIFNNYAGKTAQTKTISCTLGCRVTLCVSSLELTRLSPPTLHPQAFTHRLRFLLTFSSVNGHFNEYRLIPQMIDKLDSSHSFTDSFTKPLLRGAQDSERPKKGVDHWSSPACKGNSFLWLITSLSCKALVS